MGDREAIVGIAAAALAGLAVGVERQWSGHASGPSARFAGIRTFTLLGGLTGIAGWLWNRGDQLPAALLLGGAAALVVAAYASASRRDVEATTEVAALVVIAAGFLAGTEQLALASGVIATTVLILVEKSRLHRLVARLNDEEVRAGARFAVMAVVVLPLLPAEAYGPFGGIRPRALWAVVLLFSGISFAGYIARRAVGSQHGDAVAGLLGGLVSSTQVTISHARVSRGAPRRALPLACGAIAGSTLLFVRTLFAASVLNAGMAMSLVRYAAPAFIAGLVASALTLRRSTPGNASLPPRGNPLQLRSALQMAVVFQAIMFVVGILQARLGDTGLLLSGAAAGLTDVDAATMAMARAVSDGVAPAIAARAVGAGMLANTLLKLGLAITLGSRAFRLAAGAGLAVISIALAVALVAM